MYQKHIRPHLPLMGIILFEKGREIQDLHTIEDPGGRGVLLKLIQTSAPTPKQGNMP
ncbi:MAG: hypothetical protein ACO36I_11105 [Candidatus Latescibacterota bacterium]|jgi:hypothetical protein